MGSHRPGSPGRVDSAACKSQQYHTTSLRHYTAAGCVWRSFASHPTARSQGRADPAAQERRSAVQDTVPLRWSESGSSPECPYLLVHTCLPSHQIINLSGKRRNIRVNLLSGSYQGKGTYQVSYQPRPPNIPPINLMGQGGLFTVAAACWWGSSVDGDAAAVVSPPSASLLLLLCMGHVWKMAMPKLTAYGTAEGDRPRSAPVPPWLHGDITGMPSLLK